MPRKLRIILWVAIGLLIATLLVILSPLRMMFIHSVESMIPGFPVFYVFFGLLFACGVLIVYWTHKYCIQNAITNRLQKRYLLMAGASAMGILFFQLVVHRLTEAGMVMVIFVCPITLIVGAVLALRFRASPQATP